MDPHALSVAITLAAGCLMLLSGVGKKRLAWRRDHRRCVSCRHELDDCRCGTPR